MGIKRIIISLSLSLSLYLPTLRRAYAAKMKDDMKKEGTKVNYW
jgi:hypothetical protein